ncbi:hypothetical protein NQZ68_039999 [Dissostichus eleginoides]|nr:hypothetical protein NQZ68_039999 [Dissostichus eleginoides]
MILLDEAIVYRKTLVCISGDCRNCEAFSDLQGPCEALLAYSLHIERSSAACETIKQAAHVEAVCWGDVSKSEPSAGSRLLALLNASQRAPSSGSSVMAELLCAASQAAVRDREEGGLGLFLLHLMAVLSSVLPKMEGYATEG